jgi:hypothetical protein
MKQAYAALKNRYAVVARFHGDMTKLPLCVQAIVAALHKARYLLDGS